MRQQFLEVPFINFYRKEYVAPELQISELWRVYYMDEKWCQLQQRKRNIKRLIEKMQTFQQDTILADPDAPIPEGEKIIDHEDFERLEAVETVEELKDVYDHFLLYHAKKLAACQEHFKKKAKKEREERRMRKKLGKKKYKTVKETVTKTVTRTVSRTVTETVTNDDGDEEEIEREVEEEVETEVETEEEKEVTDDEAVDDNPDSEDDPEDVEDPEDEDIKFARRNDAYSLCVKYGVSGMAAKFGLTPEVNIVYQVSLSRCLELFILCRPSGRISGTITPGMSLTKSKLRLQRRPLSISVRSLRLSRTS